MRRILRHHHHVPLLLGQRREGGFRCGRGREPAVEEITLLPDIGHDGRRPQRQAHDARREAPSAPAACDEPQPRLPACRRTPRPHRGRERGAVREREVERHLARERSTLHELLAHGAEERVHGEEQPLGVGERVVAPLERRMRQLPRHGREDQPIVLSARELPQPHALGPESYLDRLALERRQLATGLDANAVEQRGESRIRLENRDGKIPNDWKRKGLGLGTATHAALPIPAADPDPAPDL